MEKKNKITKMSLTFCVRIFALTSLFFGEHSFAKETVKIDPTCTIKEFQELKIKQNCLLTPEMDDSCFTSAMMGAINGDSIQAENFKLLTDSLRREFKINLIKFQKIVADGLKGLNSRPISEALHNAIMNSDGSGYEWDSVIRENRARQLVRESLQKTFPKELSELDKFEKAFVDRLNEIRRDFKNSTKNVPKHDQTYRIFELKMKQLEGKTYEDFQKMLMDEFGRNPKLRLVSQLLASSDTLDRILEDRKVRVALIKNFRNRSALDRAQFIDDVYPESRTAPSRSSIRNKIASKYGLKSVAGGGAVLGVTLFADSVFETIKDRSRLEKCTKHFNFSNQEVSYLKDGPFFSLRVKTSENCNDFGLFTDDPVWEYASLLKEFGGVPAGICKMVTNSLARLKKLTPEFKLTASHCEKKEIAGSGFRIYSRNKNDRMIELTNTKGERYLLKWDDENLYPDFMSANRFGDNSSQAQQKQLSKIATERLVRYGYSNADSRTLLPPQDILSPCTEEGTYCELRDIAIRARTASAQQRILCDSAKPRDRAIAPQQAVGSSSR